MPLASRALWRKGLSWRPFGDEIPYRRKSCRLPTFSTPWLSDRVQEGIFARRGLWHDRARQVYLIRCLWMSQSRLQIQNYDRGIRFNFSARWYLRKSSILHAIAVLALVLCPSFCSRGGSKLPDDGLWFWQSAATFMSCIFMLTCNMSALILTLLRGLPQTSRYKAVLNKLNGRQRTATGKRRGWPLGCFGATAAHQIYRWGPYMSSRQIVLVAEDSGIYTLDDLNGKNSCRAEQLKTGRAFSRRRAVRQKFILKISMPSLPWRMLFRPWRTDMSTPVRDMKTPTAAIWKMER